MKTLIELYDDCQIENVISSISFKPDKIVFIGFKQNMKSSQLSSLEKFFRMKGMNIKIEYEYVSRYNYDSIVERINTIIDENEDCCFDLTGGKELVLVAMGEVSATKNVPMIQFDVKSGDLIRVNNCENLAQPDIENISIEECIVLNGGAVVDSRSYRKLSAEFCKDVKSMWEVSRRDSAAWNSNAIALATLEKNGLIDGNLFVRGYVYGIKNAQIDFSVMKSLEYYGLIENFSIEKNFVSFGYKNEQVHQCLIKSGNILELLAYMIAYEISEEEKGFYTDAAVGVTVDWDGIINSDIKKMRDTRNEIDLILMRKHIPVFISCKNGTVPKEALYELQAVAEKFGGRYSKKILLSTYINRNANARNFVLQRARDMNIEIIEGVDKMSSEDLKQIIRNRAG